MDFDVTPALNLPPPGTISLADAQASFRDAVYDKGGDCPCCGKYAKVYIRSANGAMMLCLWALSRAAAREPEREWHHVRAIDSELAIRKIQCHWSSGWGAGLAKWGLILQKPGKGKGGKSRTSGFWKMSPAGIKFLAGESRIPKEVHSYGNDTVGWSEERVTFEEALDDKFNYEKLMSLSVWTEEQAA
jgi:hypothetical protein